MTDSKKKKKKYEAPVVKEIGGIFGQAMGQSACTTGPFFNPGTCDVGLSAGGCAWGPLDQACWTGAADGQPCSMGVRAATCSRGPGN